ncbi:MAG: DUF2635 domain-containing protein [Shewanella sp.]
MFVIPEKPTVDPANGHLLPENGKNVTPSNYWHRRVACGDVRVQEDQELQAEPEPEQDSSEKGGKHVR